MLACYANVSKSERNERVILIWWFLYICLSIYIMHIYLSNCGMFIYLLLQICMGHKK